MSERDLVKQFFDRPGSLDASSVLLGIGDDAAVIRLPADQTMVCSIDTLIEGVHFPKETPADAIGYKAIAVSLSDMAAMGAEPKTALLSLTLPHADNNWLEAFSKGLFELMETYHVQLIGGDMTRGPLSITTVAHGWVPQHQALLRSSARVGDAIYVTGVLGDAGVALTNHPDPDCLQKLNCPLPRIQVGIGLRGIASAAIDISDGLATDLEKLCHASGVGADIETDKIPHRHASLEMALTAGDDFELCFTVPANQEAQLKRQHFDCRIQKIGTITAKKTVQFIHPDGSLIKLKYKGYEHF